MTAISAILRTCHLPLQLHLLLLQPEQRCHIVAAFCFPKSRAPREIHIVMRQYQGPDQYSYASFHEYEFSLIGHECTQGLDKPLLPDHSGPETRQEVSPGLRRANAKPEPMHSPRMHSRTRQTLLPDHSGPEARQEVSPGFEASECEAGTLGKRNRTDEPWRGDTKKNAR